jgi:hypothetical protein
MSTSTEYMDGLNVPAERRFYPRVTPPAPIYVAFGSNNLGVLHNVSENGFQVSTPSELPLNSVFRVFLSLNGSRKTISVTVRTVWTVDAEKRSGIQLLDLSDENREQIRQWVEFEMSRSENSTPWFLPKNGDRGPVDGNTVNPNPTRREPVNEAFASQRTRPAEPPVSAAPISDIPSQRPSETPRTPRGVLPTGAAESQPPVSPKSAASYVAPPPPTAAAHAPTEPAAAESTGLPPIANPFDDPGPNPFEQFPPVPLPIHREFEYAPPSSSSRGRRKVSSRLRAKPLILWVAALALVCVGANALVRYRISSNSRRFASESAKYTPPKSDAADPSSASPSEDSGANATTPGGAQPSTNSPADSGSDSSAASGAAQTTNAQNESSSASAATAPTSRSTSRNSETTQPDPRRGSSLDADARANRAYAATAPPSSDRSEASAPESQPAPTPRSWSAPAPNRSSSTVSASDAPQSPSVSSSSNAPAQSNSAPIVSQTRPVPPVTAPVQTPATSSVSNSPSSSSSNGVVNNANTAPARTQPPAGSQQSSTYASNANTTPPSRSQTPIYNANTPAQRSAFMGSINSVHSSGIFDSNDSTSAATNPAPPVASRGPSANVATRPVSNAAATVAPTDVPQDRDIEIPAPKGFNASWVDLPGEHVVRSAAGTVHIHRMVRVPGERIPGQRWLWKGRLDVTLGNVVNRIDPSVVQASGASGSLTVMASIDKDGYVTDLKPLNGNFALLPAVSRTVRNWHYQPTYLDNKRAETQAQIEFDLRPVPVSASNRAGRP